MAGFRELLAVEWDDHAVDCFRLNFPDVPVYHGDIATLSVEKCCDLAGIAPGELDVMDGSPPCQGFSTAGSRQMEDPRNALFLEFVRLLDGLQPRAFVMENVPGMVKGKMKLVFAEAIVAMKACGYNVAARVLNAAHYGVPQDRHRVIFVGVREDLGVKPSYPLGVRDALGVRQGWGQHHGIRNEQFNHRFRSLDLPCPTLTKTRPPMIAEGDHERELTLGECSIIGSYPDKWQWTGIARSDYARIGNSVPPLFMKAIAETLRQEVLSHGNA